MKAMLIEYMGKGFLDNIIAMFRQDRSLFRFVADMLGAGDLRVRLGTVALVEELAAEHGGELRAGCRGSLNCSTMGTRLSGETPPRCSGPSRTAPRERHLRHAYRTAIPACAKQRAMRSRKSAEGERGGERERLVRRGGKKTLLF